MGQLIKVTATPLGDVALFDLDRSITGQDGQTFNRPPTEHSDVSSELAHRMFSDVTNIESLHALSNTVSIKRQGGWDDDSLELASEVIANLFVFYEVETQEQLDQRLRDENYNATITSIRAHNPDLWVMRITPDEPIEPFKPGQYTTLALGYWESRADEAFEDFEEHPEQHDKMARRSYSVSSSIVTPGGELVEAHPEDVEFYIVQVRPGAVEVPALTPRIFMKGVGDKLFMSHKFTGRYTLDDVNPTDNVVFLSTGTGEAPQNLMTAEMLREGHGGTILSVVCVRYLQDLAYTSEQEIVQATYPNYRYEPLTTREPENLDNKIYIQDLVESGQIEELLGATLDPSNTHVFLCGNPSMIGLPKWTDDGVPTFPESVGVCELLHKRGFTIDHRKVRGNVHYEEYWKDR